MARSLRPQFHGAVWHAYNRGANRASIFLTDQDRILFIELLAEVVGRFHWVIHQFTLMNNHFHLAIETPEPTLSRGMKYLEQKYVQAFNRRHGRSGPMFEGRFKSQLVEKEGYLLELMRYIALNPVRAGMVAHPEEYQWSSFRWLAGLDPAPSWIDPRWALSHFGSDLDNQQRSFRKFVDEGAGIIRGPWEKAVGQILIGSTVWVERLRGELESKPRSADHPAMQRYASRPRPAKIVEVVAEVFGSDVETIRNSHGTIERRVVAWLGCYESIARLGSVAALLRLRSTSRVSALIAECDRDVGRDPDLRQSIDDCLKSLRHNLVRVPTLHRANYPATPLHPS